MSATVFAAAFAALYAAHQVGDHWVQTHHQATGKGRPGWAGRLHCAAHVATYLATGLAALGVTCAVAGLPVDFTGAHLWAAIAVNGLTHYIADRRAPLLWLARKTGHGDFVDTCGPEAAYKMDQSWHVGFLFLTALIIAAGTPAGL